MGIGISIAVIVIIICCHGIFCPRQPGSRWFAETVESQLSAAELQKIEAAAPEKAICDARKGEKDISILALQWILSRKYPCREQGD